MGLGTIEGDSCSNMMHYLRGTLFHIKCKLLIKQGLRRNKILGGLGITSKVFLYSKQRALENTVDFLLPTPHVSGPSQSQKNCISGWGANCGGRRPRFWSRSALASCDLGNVI